MSAVTDAATRARGFLGAWVFLLLTLSLAEINVISDNRLLDWLLVGSITAALGSIPVLIYQQRRRHNQFPLSQARAFAMASLLGLLLGIAQLAITLVLGIEPFRQQVLMVASSTLTVGLFGTAALLFGQEAASQIKQRQQSLDEAIALAQAREDVADITQRMHTVLTHDIDAALSPARASIEERLRDQERQLDAEEWKAAAGQLRAAAKETVSPLSRSLWVPVTEEGRPIGIAQVLRNVVTKQALRPGLMALVVAVTLLPTAVGVAGWVIGGVGTAIGVLYIFVCLNLGNAIMRRWPRHHASVFLIFAVGVQAGHLLFIPVRNAAGARPYTLGEFLAASVIGISLIILTSSFGSFRSYRQDVARLIEAELDSELTESIAVSRQVAQLARESARILHGTVQTRLVACAVAIERAADTNDAEAFQAALQEAHAVLADPTRIDTAEGSTVAAEVQRKVALWSGLCDITIDVDARVADTTDRLARDIGRVVEEGLSNAIRHGGAGAIHVSIQERDGRIVVVVDDDGTGPQSGPRGLGSALLDSVSNSWELKSTAKGARLTARIA